jgi:hypothetical protein
MMEADQPHACFSQWGDCSVGLKPDGTLPDSFQSSVLSLSFNSYAFDENNSSSQDGKKKWLPFASTFTFWFET